MLSVDLAGAFRCLQRAARRMIDQDRGGRLIAVTSVHEHQPRVGSAPHSGLAWLVGDGLPGGVLADRRISLDLAAHVPDGQSDLPGGCEDFLVVE